MKFGVRPLYGRIRIRTHIRIRIRIRMRIRIPIRTRFFFRVSENEMMGIVWNGFWWSLEVVGVDFGG